MEINNSNLRFMSNMNYGNKPNIIVLHHAAIESCTIEEIHLWHLNKGWAGCGYHYFVKKDGSIYKGREDDVVGAHSLNHNTNSLGICAEGNFMEETMEETQINAIIELCKFLKKKYEITKIYAHKELNATDCPGVNYPLVRIINLQSKSSPLTYPGYLIRWNNKRDVNIALVQKKLIEKGYSVGKSGADGYFGEDTYAAVMKFQKDKKLIMDGVVGPVIWSELF